jgi:hypothetical protein
LRGSGWYIPFISINSRDSYPIIPINGIPLMTSSTLIAYRSFLIAQVMRKTKAPQNLDPARCRGRKVYLSPVSLKARSAVPVLWDQCTVEVLVSRGTIKHGGWHGMAASPLSDLGPSTSSRIQCSTPNLCL